MTPPRREQRTAGPPATSRRGDHRTSHGDEVVVERVGAALVVHAAGTDDPALRALAAALPATPAPIVVDAAGVPDAALFGRLASAVTAAVDEGTRTFRVVGRDLPRVDPGWWRRLADRTGAELLVPSGRVTVAGATLFVHGADEGSAGTWWRCAPGVPAVLLGARHPVPSWQAAVPEELPTVHGLLATQHLPGGVLLRPATTALDTRWRVVPADPDHLTVIAGVPGGPHVRAADVASYLGSIPEKARATARLACGTGQDVVALGCDTAEFLGSGVTVVDGTPVVRENGIEFVFHDLSGAATWTPYLQEIHCLTGATTAVPRRWRAPRPDLAPYLPGAFRVTDRWLLVVMRSGLWLRQVSRPWHPVPVGRSVNPAVKVIAVGDPGESLPDDVWPLVSDLLDDFAPSALRRVRLSVLGVPSRRGRAVLEELTGRGRGGLRASVPT
ncbi:hypothetical protein [Saccharothrix yanglingensis]|uniref:hypothetical protein n=1 Tax=Saccharothrix yanglingensis TaxID=659496 RepID=UPI0027D337E8|nr:hypothetical protein [Saccharothrix yanglingensis]